MKPGDVRVLKDNTKKFFDALAALNSNVLVGIPAVNGTRQDGDGFDNLSNAAIGYVQENGSDLAGIPPRPFLLPGVKNVEDEVAAEFKKAAKEGFNNPGKVMRYFERAGIIAMNSVKKTLRDGGIWGDYNELADSTVAARKAQGFKGEKPLIRTGQLLNSITYVIEKG